jgi:hypothetical protein
MCVRRSLQRKLRANIDVMMTCAVIEELFTADCVVHGGLEASGEAAHGPLYGVEGVYAHVSALLIAFPRYARNAHATAPQTNLSHTAHARTQQGAFHL